jgi:hypothetical protein
VRVWTKDPCHVSHPSKLAIDIQRLFPMHVSTPSDRTCLYAKTGPVAPKLVHSAPRLLHDQTHLHVSDRTHKTQSLIISRPPDSAEQLWTESKRPWPDPRLVSSHAQLAMRRHHALPSDRTRWLESDQRMTVGSGHPCFSSARHVDITRPTSLGPVRLHAWVRSKCHTPQPRWSPNRTHPT